MNTIFRKKTINQAWAAIFVITVILLNFGCGPYSFKGTSIPSHIKTVAIPLFEDHTSEFGIKEDVTDAVIQEITSDNTLKITNESEADAIVYGKILSIRDEAYTYTANEQVESFRVYIDVEVEVRDVQKATDLWKERWSQWGEYSPAPGPSERQATLESAIQKIAEDVINKTVSGW